ncbi:MAG TPA: glutamate--tRNA ligase [bacterium]|jgi:glutamyl-tRNA synthetase|nr:glutamate--tRNA ligase [bacterium]HRR91346.1 glutamate--tRNA ligase [bacterium]
MGVRVRFAPSPSGSLHIGNVRTALFNWLFARKNNGIFILRIEDTDIERTYESAYSGILEDLAWLGLNWDEGPYKQSDRLDIYKSYAERFLKEGLAYKCFCSPEELEREREQALKEGKPPRYSGKCANLTEEEISRLESEGKSCSIRFRIPEDACFVVEDIIRGKIEFDVNAITGDFIILRSDGMPTYNFAVVIDDHLMKITHVIRGEDHLSNTPRQLLIYRALEAEPPVFAHLPMIVGSDHSKLSKREGSFSVKELREQGFLPEGVVNYLALLGWSPKEEEVKTLEELIEEFSLEDVSPSPSAYDPAKLRWINRQHILRLDGEKLLSYARPFLKEFENFPKEWLIKAILSIREYAETLKDIPEEIKKYYLNDISLDDKYREELLSGKKAIEVFLDLLKNAEDISDIDSLFKEAIKVSGLKGRRFYHPIRIALTGYESGPELVELIPILGKRKCIERLENSLRFLEAEK